MISDLHKSCKDKSFYGLFTQLPLMLKYPGYICQNEESSLVHYSLNSRLYLDFTNFPTSVSFLFQDPPRTPRCIRQVSSVCSALWQFLSLSLFFRTLKLLKGTDRYFVECPSLWVCLMFSCDYTRSGGRTAERRCPLSASCQHDCALVMPIVFTWLGWRLAVFSL